MDPLAEMCDARCVMRSKKYPASRIAIAPVAQLDRAPDFESVGRGFESLRARLETTMTPRHKGQKEKIRESLSDLGVLSALVVNTSLSRRRRRDLLPYLSKLQ
jgi:hypothetical protein